MHTLAAITTTSPAAGTTTTSATPQPRLVTAAHEFEAQMMKELMKPMTSSDALTGDDDGGDSGSGGALGEFAQEALGRALSDGGGFGIANRIVHDLSNAGKQAGTSAVTGKTN